MHWTRILMSVRACGGRHVGMGVYLKYVAVSNLTLFRTSQKLQALGRVGGILIGRALIVVDDIDIILQCYQL